MATAIMPPSRNKQRKERESIQGKSLAEIATRSKKKSISEYSTSDKTISSAPKPKPKPKARKNKTTPDKLDKLFDTSDEVRQTRESIKWRPVIGRWYGQHKVVSETSQGNYRAECVCGQMSRFTAGQVRGCPSCNHPDSPERGLSSDNKALYMHWRRMIRLDLEETEDTVCVEWRSYRAFEQDVSTLDYAGKIFVRVDQFEPWSLSNITMMTKWQWKSVIVWAYVNVNYEGGYTSALRKVITMGGNLEACITYYRRYTNAARMITWLSNKVV